MTSEERSYIAGIIDGEGSIMLIKFHKNQFPSPCISISSTSMELLTWIKNKTQIGTIKGKKNYNPEKHLDSYTYLVRYDAAIRLMVDIYPYLVIPQKKARCKLIIEKYKSVTSRNGRYTKEMLHLKEMFYEEFMSII